MKHTLSIAIAIITLFVWGCNPPPLPIDYALNSPVNWDFEDSSKVLYKTFNISFEETKDGRYIYKKYYPTTSVKTYEITYSDAKREKREGQFIHRFDNGNIWTEGNFHADKHQGEWKYYHTNGVIKKVGSYKNGEPIGNWQEFNKDSIKVVEYNFNDEGQLHGKYTYFNKIGDVTKEIIYEKGEILKTRTFLDSESDIKYEIVEKMPTYGKDCFDIEDIDLKKACSDKAMLTQIYTEIKYPTFARENDITGSAYINFVVEKDGSVTEVEVLNGLCDEIRDECYRVVKTFDEWQPGYQNDEPVRVQFMLPIRFRLE